MKKSKFTSRIFEALRRTHHSVIHALLNAELAVQHSLDEGGEHFLKVERSQSPPGRQPDGPDERPPGPIRSEAKADVCRTRLRAVT